MVLTVAVNIGTVTIGDVYNRDTKLIENIHYTVNGGTVTLNATYLVTLVVGNHTITFKTDKGDVDAVITVVDTTDVA